jgi:5-(hydroxymethyl)furfural/furfural oxidase
LPYFKKVERDLDFDGPLMARTAASRCDVFRMALTKHSQAAAEACKLAGHAFVPTRTASSPTVGFSGDASERAEQRVSVAMGYLDRETRKREPDHLDRHGGQGALFEGTRCVGVKALVAARNRIPRPRSSCRAA